MRVGLIGLGNMGYRMAERLLDEGFQLIVYNRTRERALPLAERGAEVASSPRELAYRADVIIDMVSDEAAVRNTLLSEDGAITGARPGAVVVEMSTLYPQFVRELEEAARERDIGLLDAPVLGSTTQAREGRLSIMVGGDEDVYERARPVLDALGSHRLVGPVGMGTAYKLVINAILISMVGVMAEGLALAEAMGVDPESALEVMGEHPVGKAAGYYWRRMLDDSAPVRFALRLAEKDMRYVLRTAADLVRELPIMAEVQQTFLRAKRLGLGDLDYSKVFRSLGDRSQRPPSSSRPFRPEGAPSSTSSPP
ncbi:MAG: NAD(P)-dependent oxidoreductase [Candidatus Korarchaeota archaeon]|nr:NAD(P)-dependent oxidoreductase [Candidatus Korarchaeota archaeon]